jgi:PPOX class probable F420-dependent enzyme
MALSDEKYVLLTTFKRDGSPVATPVWIVGLDDGTYGFWTSSGSGKAKRLSHTERVTVQASDARGRVKAGSEPINATARLITGPDMVELQGKIKAKYGIMTSIAKALGQIGGTLKGHRIPYGDRGVVITLTS